MRSRGRSGRGCCSSRLELAALVVLQAAEPGDLEPVLLEQSRGTRGSSPALSSGEDRPVLWKLAETALELAHRDVDVAFAAGPLFELLSRHCRTSRRSGTKTCHSCHTERDRHPSG